MKNLVYKINKMLSWKPNRIFRKSYLDENFEWQYDHTNLYDTLDKFPPLLGALIEIAYYVTSWPLYLCVKAPWWIVSNLIFPRSWLR